jgi:hypothetical protein
MWDMISTIVLVVLLLASLVQSDDILRSENSNLNQVMKLGYGQSHELEYAIHYPYKNINIKLEHYCGGIVNII